MISWKRGDPTSFSVSAQADEGTGFSGGSPVYGSPGDANAGLNYQWYNGDPNGSGVALTNGGVYSGVNSATLSISNSTGLIGTDGSSHPR